ncbi:MAG: nucleotidyltransferase domain-containing protein [Candidatus Atribacteria bacterium]|nr:nucleotidyltransferase domain-containing protein [Candidatus Atribacteria bacterium]
MAPNHDLVHQLAQKAVDLLSSRLIIKAAYLYGSHITGSADKQSDIDIGIFIEGYNTFSLSQIVKLIILVQKEIDDTLDIHFFPAEALTHEEPGSFASFVIKHGLLIHHQDYVRAV